MRLHISAQSLRIFGKSCWSDRPAESSELSALERRRLGVCHTLGQRASGKAKRSARVALAQAVRGDRGPTSATPARPSGFGNKMSEDGKIPNDEK